MKINLQNVRVTSYTTHSSGASARPGKTLEVIAPRGTFRPGQRIRKLKLEDEKGDTVALELAHVVQQRQAAPRAGDKTPKETVTIVYEAIQRPI